MKKELNPRGTRAEHLAVYKKGDSPKKDVDTAKDTGRGAMPKKPAKYRRSNTSKTTKDAFHAKQSKWRS